MFVRQGQELAPHQIKDCNILPLCGAISSFSFQNITFKLGNFTDIEAFFPVVNIYP